MNTRQVMSANRTRFLNYPVDNLTLEELLELIGRGIKHRDLPRQVAVINANKIYLMDKHPELAQAVAYSGLIIPENAVYLGSKWIGNRLKESNLGGITLIKKLLRESHRNRYRYYFLGSKPKVIECMRERCRLLYPELRAVGWRHGYFDESESSRIVEEIREARPDVLFVALGSPKQELWIYHNLGRLQVPFSVGVGGSFEVIAGLKKDAPQWVKNGFEWLYRSIQDPRKLRRYLVVNSYFMYRIALHFFQRARGVRG